MNTSYCIFDQVDMTFKGKILLTLKGTSRGPEALQSHLNDSYRTNVLCWPWQTINLCLKCRKMQLDVEVSPPAYIIKMQISLRSSVLSLINFRHGLGDQCILDITIYPMFFVQTDRQTESDAYISSLCKLHKWAQK